MTIYIVSGLPRSGTSMMMLILKEGGLEPYYDPDIVPNINNPNGFFETKKLNEYQNPEFKEWMGTQEGKSFKVVYQYLNRLPSEYQYKIIIMKRNMEEVITSRKKVLAYFNNRIASEPDGYFYYMHNLWIDEGYLTLNSSANMQYIEIDYNLLMQNKEIELKKVIDFLPELDLNLSRMVLVPDDFLYRNRKLL